MCARRWISLCIILFSLVPFSSRQVQDTDKICGCKLVTLCLKIVLLISIFCYLSLLKKIPDTDSDIFLTCQPGRAMFQM